MVTRYTATEDLNMGRLDIQIDAAHARMFGLLDPQWRSLTCQQ